MVTCTARLRRKVITYKSIRANRPQHQVSGVHATQSLWLRINGCTTPRNSSMQSGQIQALYRGSDAIKMYKMLFWGTQIVNQPWRTHNWWILHSIQFPEPQIFHAPQRYMHETCFHCHLELTHWLWQVPHTKIMDYHCFVSSIFQYLDSRTSPHKAHMQ